MCGWRCEREAFWGLFSAAVDGSFRDTPQAVFLVEEKGKGKGGCVE